LKEIPSTEKDAATSIRLFIPNNTVQDEWYNKRRSLLLDTPIQQSDLKKRLTPGIRVPGFNIIIGQEVVCHHLFFIG
jgi:hypothetical protein